MLRILIILFYPLFLGIWRRAFGCDCWNIPVLKNRFVLHIIGFLVAVGACYGLGYHWIQCLLLGGVLQGLYWALGHGPAYDMSRGGYPDAEMIKRYEKFFWDKWCKFLVPKYSWYGFGYDFLWMMFRYGLPACLMAIVLLNPYVAGCGIATTLIYAICWSLQDKGKLHHLFATELAEILAGVCTGILIVC